MESTYQSESGYSRDFSRLTNQISSQIAQITKNVAQIQRMVSMLGTPQDSDQARHRLHELQHQTHTLCQTTMEALKDLSSLAQPLGADRGQIRQWKLQRERLTNDFSVVLNNFQSVQRTAAMKEKASVSKALDSAAKRDLFDTDAFSGDTAAGGGQSDFQIAQTVDVQTIREREKALRELESDILDVNQIFKDLALMVHQQGEVVDSIEGNIESAVGNVDRGGTNLRQAADYSRRLRRKRIFCMILLIVVVIILALIIYFSTRSSGEHPKS